MNKKQGINPALARIQQIKSRSASGAGSSFSTIEPFANPIIEEPVSAVPPVQEELPPLEEDQDEARVAMRLIAMQAQTLGSVAPTDTKKYNDLKGLNDKMLEKMLEKKW